MTVTVSTAMDPNAVEPFLRYLRSQRYYVGYAHVAAFTILRWTYTMILFILTRYLPIGYAYLVIHNHLLLGVGPSDCPMTYPAATWMVLAGITFAEIVLAIRTWAVWRCNLRVGLLLTALHISYPVVSCIYVLRYLKSFIYEPIPYPGFRGCFVVASSGVEPVVFVALTVIETVVFCLMATSAFQAYRSGLTSQFSGVVHRDALHYYAFLMCLAIANVAVMLGTPAEYQNLLTPLQGVLHSIFTCRIIINIRVADKRGSDSMPTELHTQNFDTDLSLTLRFEERPEEVTPQGSPVAISMTSSSL